MDIYFPIAEIALNGLWVVMLGLCVGIVSGLMGVGGGWLMTPLLIFSGIPPAVAVSTQANQMVATGTSGILARLSQKKKTPVDYKLGLMLTAGGLGGSFLGVSLFSFLRAIGQIDIVISVLYIVVLGSIAAYMLYESYHASHGKKKHRKGKKKRGHLREMAWIRGLPYKQRFPASGIYISALVPAGLGFVVGILLAFLGIGGGIIMVPAMIYLLGTPEKIVPATNLLQVVLVAMFVTLLHAVQNQTIDILLVAFLMSGGVVGARIGASYSHSIPHEYIRIAMGVIVVLLCLKMGLNLSVTPDQLYEVVVR